MTHSGTWDGLFRVLRDPIFALVFAVFLAFLGSRPIRRLARTVFWLAAIVILIWLAAHNASSAHVEITVVADATRVLLMAIVALFAVALIAVAILFIAYLKTAPASSSPFAKRAGLRARTSFLGSEFTALSTSEPRKSLYSENAGSDVADKSLSAEADRITEHLDRLMCLLGALFEGVDYDNPVRACAEVMRIYLSGLTARSIEIRKIHEECNKSITRIANSSLIKAHDIYLPLRDMSRKNWFPNSGEWAAVTEDMDFRLPYLALRVICLKADWRAVALVMYKSYVCLAILAQIDEL